MLTRRSIADPVPAATKRVVVCLAFLCLSLLAILRLGHFPKTQAADKALPTHQVSAAAAKTQPQVVASYGKLPLSFEANQGQSDGRVKFL